jgi:hypothetical protein
MNGRKFPPKGTPSNEQRIVTALESIAEYLGDLAYHQDRIADVLVESSVETDPFTRAIRISDIGN